MGYSKRLGLTPSSGIWTIIDADNLDCVKYSPQCTGRLILRSGPTHSSAALVPDTAIRHTKAGPQLYTNVLINIKEKPLEADITFKPNSGSIASIVLLGQ